jgi:hypothetical protein
MADYNNRRLYREIMREAILLGDKFLVDMVLMRLAKLTQPSMASDTKSNIISFPCGPISAIPALRKEPRKWVTVLQTAMIPLGLVLALMALHYWTLASPFSCPP